MRGYKNAGAFFEKFAFTEILKCRVHNAGKAEFHFHRDSRTREDIDPLIRRNGTLHPSKSR